MKSAMTSGEILVGYGNAENSDPVRDACKGCLYNDKSFLFVGGIRQLFVAAGVTEHPQCREFAPPHTQRQCWTFELFLPFQIGSRCGL